MLHLKPRISPAQAQQLGIGKLRFPAADMGSGQTDPGQDPIIEEDVKCGQEGVEVIVHTKGLTPSANDLSQG